jgi:hypothetical protein
MKTAAGSLAVCHRVQQARTSAAHLPAALATFCIAQGEERSLS